MGALRDCLAWLGMDFEADEPDNVEPDHESESQVIAPLQSTIPDPAAVSPGRASGALDSEAESSSHRRRDLGPATQPRTLLDEIMVSRDRPNNHILQFTFASKVPWDVPEMCRLVANMFNLRITSRARHGKQHITIFGPSGNQVRYVLDPSMSDLRDGLQHDMEIIFKKYGGPPQFLEAALTDLEQKTKFASFLDHLHGDATNIWDGDGPTLVTKGFQSASEPVQICGGKVGLLRRRESFSGSHRFNPRPSLIGHMLRGDHKG